MVDGVDALAFRLRDGNGFDCRHRLRAVCLGGVLDLALFVLVPALALVHPLETRENHLTEQCWDPTRPSRVCSQPGLDIQTPSLPRFLNLQRQSIASNFFQKKSLK